MAREKNEEKEKEEGAEQEPKKRSPMKLIILAVVVVLILGGGAAAYFLFFAKGGGPSAEKKSEQTEANKGETEKTALKNMDPFIVNLTDAQGTRYLKAVIQLELNSELAAQEIDQMMPPIRDDIISLLSSKSFEDISTEPGKRELKKAMLERINKNLKNGRVTRVFFTEFVVQ